MMRFIIFIAIISVVFGNSRIQQCGFEEELLKGGFEAPFSLAVDWITNTLFFTVTPSLDVNDTLSAAYLNLDTKEFGMIPEISTGIAVTVDNKDHIIYLNGLEGIHTYDITTKKLTFVGEKEEIVWQMFFKDHLYFTVLGNESVFVYKNGKSEKIKGLDVEIVLAGPVIGVDKHDNIWFSDEGGLFYFNKVDGRRILVSDKYYALAFTTDIEGNLLFIDSTGVYQINEDKSILNLFERESLVGIAVDSHNNIIYSDEHNIFRLNPIECIE